MIVSTTTAKIRNLVKIKEIKNISHKETKLGQEERMLSSQREKKTMLPESLGFQVTT